MELITSKLIAVPHGFPTRSGGVSQGPYASLNAGLNTGDDRTHVEQNLRLVAEAATVAAANLFTVSQVHGDAVLEVGEVPAAAGLRAPVGEADALWTGREGRAVGVKTADCVPILLCDPVGLRVAAVHAGWRGTYSRIVEKAVEALTAAGSRPGDLRAAVGPSIQSCCYEVGPDLAERFEEAFGPGVVVAGERPRLSLQLAVRQSLERVGLEPGQIELLPQCTHCDARFYSHRRDRGVTGRHLSFIASVWAPAGTRGPPATGL